jgi:hypothetical protein
MIDLVKYNIRYLNITLDLFLSKTMNKWSVLSCPVS